MMLTEREIFWYLGWGSVLVELVIGVLICLGLMFVHAMISRALGGRRRELW